MFNERFFKCCKDCTRRVVGCHSRCADYAAAVRERNEYKEARSRDEQVINYYGDKKRRMKAFYYKNGGI